MSEKTYEEKIKEVDDIVKKLEKNELSVDELIPKIKIASEYLKDCYTKITQIEKEADTALLDLKSLNGNV